MRTIKSVFLVLFLSPFISLASGEIICNPTFYVEIEKAADFGIIAKHAYNHLANFDEIAEKVYSFSDEFHRHVLIDTVSFLDAVEIRRLLSLHASLENEEQKNLARQYLLCYIKKTIQESLSSFIDYFKNKGIAPVLVVESDALKKMIKVLLKEDVTVCNFEMAFLFEKPLDQREHLYCLISKNKERIDAALEQGKELIERQSDAAEGFHYHFLGILVSSKQQEVA